MRERVSRDVLAVHGGSAALTLYRDDLGSVYPGMVRYSLILETPDRRLALFSTNTYEYPPHLSIDAEGAARRVAADWATAIREHPEVLLRPISPAPPLSSAVPPRVLILQGSPRPDGSCAILAGWAAEAVASVGQTAEVVFVHDLGIAPCIGCYQCYSTGDCTFDDDMSWLGPYILAAPLIVACSPVYTNTVPAGLKAVIDRAQALHARSALLGTDPPPPRTGVLLATAGRDGVGNFGCVRSVVRAFMENLGIRLAGEVLVDGMDRQRDLRAIPDLEARVRSTVLSALPPAAPASPPGPEP